MLLEEFQCETKDIIGMTFHQKIYRTTFLHCAGLRSLTSISTMFGALSYYWDLQIFVNLHYGTAKFWCDLRLNALSFARCPQVLRMGTNLRKIRTKHSRFNELSVHPLKAVTRWSGRSGKHWFRRSYTHPIGSWFFEEPSNPQRYFKYALYSRVIRELSFGGGKYVYNP